MAKDTWVCIDEGKSFLCKQAPDELLIGDVFAGGGWWLKVTQRVWAPTYSKHEGTINGNEYYTSVHVLVVHATRIDPPPGSLGLPPDERDE